MCNIVSNAQKYSKTLANNMHKSNATTLSVPSSTDKILLYQATPKVASMQTTSNLAALLPSKEEKGVHTSQNLH